MATNNERPAPAATPSAAAIQIDAAVVSPLTIPLDVVMTPAPRKPTPVAAAAATRAASPFFMRRPAHVKHAEPIETSAIVRTPTGESRLVARPRPILSKPSALPDAAATTKRQHIWSCASVETVGSARRVVCLRRRGGARRGGASAADDGARE